MKKSKCIKFLSEMGIKKGSVVTGLNSGITHEITSNPFYDESKESFRSEAKNLSGNNPGAIGYEFLIADEDLNIFVEPIYK